MKHKNKVKRLKARIRDYEAMMSRLRDMKGFHKPGSVNK